MVQTEQAQISNKSINLLSNEYVKNRSTNPWYKPDNVKMDPDMADVQTPGTNRICVERHPIRFIDTHKHGNRDKTKRNAGLWQVCNSISSTKDNQHETSEQINVRPK